MSGHEAWHVVLLAFSLAAMAGILVIVMAPLLFETQPRGMARAKPFVVGLAAVAGLLYLWEWVVTH